MERKSYAASTDRKATVAWGPGELSITDRQTGAVERITAGVGMKFDREAVEAILAARGLIATDWVEDVDGGQLTHAWPAIQ